MCVLLSCQPGVCARVHSCVGDPSRTDYNDEVNMSSKGLHYRHLQLYCMQCNWWNPHACYNDVTGQIHMHVAVMYICAGLAHMQLNYSVVYSPC